MLFVFHWQNCQQASENIIIEKCCPFTYGVWMSWFNQLAGTCRAYRVFQLKVSLSQFWHEQTTNIYTFFRLTAIGSKHAHCTSSAVKPFQLQPLNNKFASLFCSVRSVSCWIPHWRRTTHFISLSFVFTQPFRPNSITFLVRRDKQLGNCLRKMPQMMMDGLLIFNFVKRLAIKSQSAITTHSSRNEFWFGRRYSFNGCQQIDEWHGCARSLFFAFFGPMRCVNCSIFASLRGHLFNFV